MYEDKEQGSINAFSEQDKIGVFNINWLNELTNFSHLYEYSINRWVDTSFHSEREAFYSMHPLFGGVGGIRCQKRCSLGKCRCNVQLWLMALVCHSLHFGSLFAMGNNFCICLLEFLFCMWQTDEQVFFCFLSNLFVKNLWKWFLWFQLCGAPVTILVRINSKATLVSVYFNTAEVLNFPNIPFQRAVPTINTTSHRQGGKHCVCVTFWLI